MLPNKNESYKTFVFFSLLNIIQHKFVRATLNININFFFLNIHNMKQGKKYIPICLFIFILQCNTRTVIYLNKEKTNISYIYQLAYFLHGLHVITVFFSFSHLNQIFYLSKLFSRNQWIFPSYIQLCCCFWLVKFRFKILMHIIWFLDCFFPQ